MASPAWWCRGGKASSITTSCTPPLTRTSIRRICRPLSPRAEFIRQIKTARFCRAVQTADKPRRIFGGVLFCAAMSGFSRARMSGQARLGRWAQRQSDLFDVLGCGSEQALEGDGEQAPEAGIAVAVELLGVGEGPLDRLLAPLVDALAPGSETVCVGSFARLGPDVADDETGRVAARSTLREQTGGPANPRI